MAKKGVYKITGNSKPKTGDKTLYKVTEWYPDTPSSDRKESMIVWELFRKNKDGRFITTGIKKRGIGEFTFGRKSHQFTFKVEGYLHRPEGKEPMAIIVQPQQSNEKLSKEKAITGVKITYQDGSRVTKPLSYRDRLRAIAHCKNLEGQFINLGLWEDHEKGNGHSKKNKLIIKSPPILVDTKGYARWNFNLIPTFVTLSLKREDNKKYQEYYVTAEYNGKIQASDNVNTNIPQYKVPPLSVKKPQPKPETPKGSTNPNSTNNKPDQKGNIHNIKLVDKNGKAFSRKPNFGETIKLIIEGKDLIGKKYILMLWEHDNTGGNDLVYKKTHIFKADRQEVLITLTDEMRKIGELGKDHTNPDSGEYWTGRWQEIFAEIIFHSISTKSQIIDVGLLEKPKPLDTGRSPVKKEDRENQKHKINCFCNRKITPEELREMVVSMRKATYDDSGENFYKWNKDNLFTEGHEQFSIKTYNKFAEVLNKTFENYDINTCIRKIHFLGQCYHETGAFMKSIEGKKNQEYWYDPYRGRGFIHLTLQGNYQKFENISGYKVVKNPKLVSTDIEIAAMSSGWYWKYNDIGDINPFADKDSIFDTSRLVNKPNAIKSSSINGYIQRVNAVNALKAVFKYPENCINLEKKEGVKDKKICSSGLKHCICNDVFNTREGFINHSRITKSQISVIEHSNFKDSKKSIQKIILHRTAGGTSQACLNAFKNGRKNKNGGIDYYGTHFIVGKDGSIIQTANLSKITWHCAGWNSKSIGIEVVGFAVDKNGRPTLGLKGQNPVIGWENLTEEQTKSVTCLVKALLNYYSLDKSKIDCHEHLAPKQAGEGQIVYDAIKNYL